MFTYDNLLRAELEITNRCQASCPMCPRNINGGIENPSLKLGDWTLEDFTTIFHPGIVSKVIEFIFCGSFGDPALNDNLIDMCSYIKQHNPTANVIIHTNGSLRKESWWQELAQALPENHEVLFAIDGIDQQTHATYRIGTVLTKVMGSATAFITAGGSATWSFLRFKHNQDQLEVARAVAKKLGFKKFNLKDTRRFTGPDFKVLDSDGGVSHYLKPTTENVIHFVNRQTIESTQDEWSTCKDIYCYAQDIKSIYIDANLNLVPCCIIGSFLYTNYDETILKQHGLFDDTSIVFLGERMKKNLYEMIDEKFGGLDKLNAKTQGIENIINSQAWQTVWTDGWQNNGLPICSVMCSKKSPFIPLTEQRQDVQI